MSRNREGSATTARAGQTGLLLLLRELMVGRTYDRKLAAERLRVEPPAAYRMLNLLARHVPGVIKKAARRTQVFSYKANATLSDPPKFPTVVAACFGASLAALFEGSNYPEQMRGAVDYLVRRSRNPRRFADLSRKFWFVARGGEMALPEHGGRLDDLIDAVLKSVRVRLRYVHFRGESEDVVVEPLSLIVHEHQLYVLARPPSGRAHPYRFSRIADHELLEERFAYPAATEYDPQQVLRDSFGIFIGEDHPVQDVVLLLDPSWATYVRTHRWHPSQQTSARPDGIEVRLRVRTCPELRRWILGFGGEAEVLAPAGLRDAVGEAARRAAARYEAPRTGPSK